MLPTAQLCSLVCLIIAGLNYGISLTNLPVQIIEKYAEITHFDPEDNTITSILEVSFCVGAAVGAFSSQLIAKKFGYPRSICFFFFSGILMNAVLCVPVHWIYLTVFRTICGYFTSSLNTICPLLVAQHFDPHTREKAMMSYDFSLNAGVTIAFVIHYGISYQYNYWQITYAAPMLCDVIGVGFSFYMIKKVKMLSDAKLAILDQERSSILEKDTVQYTETYTDVSTKVVTENHSSNHDQHPAEVKSSSVIVFTKKQLFRLRYVAVALGSFQMLTGIDAIIMYASDILAKEFNSYRIGILGSVALGVVNMSTVLVAAQLVSRFDRRKMLLIGIIGVSACNIGIAICYLLQPVNELLLLILMLLFQIFYCSGPEPIVFMFFSEMFPNEHKNQLSSLGYGANWLTNIIVVFTFQFFEGRLWILYFIYAGATLVLGISGTVLAPETRGKSLDEIEAIIAKW
ncbi:Hexose_transporter [Hexamita inflata]|uniref:Hexose transporter n=1 Tax=Hexamita inflata TaxID=28002 RepID=A0AA86UY44_9EUKA|nr:Hexose transporter [Hexamita inflata]